MFSEPKSRAMKKAGFNRVNIGVQQFSDKLIHCIGRHQKLDQVHNSLELCHQYGLADSVDLIYGWPEKTSSSSSVRDSTTPRCFSHYWQASALG